MSHFPSQLQVCVIKKVFTSGNILLECYSLLWRRATFYLNVTRCYDVAQNAATSAIGFSIWTVRASFSRSQHFSECYPPLYILCKNGVTFKIFKQTTEIQEIMRYNKVDCHPSESIAYLGSASVDNVSSGLQSTMSPCKECDIYILLYLMLVSSNLIGQLNGWHFWMSHGFWPGY